SMIDLLSGLPPEIEGPSAWFGPELSRSADWIEYLSPTEIDEVAAATKRLVSPAREIVDIRRDDFSLPTLGPRLRQILDDVLHKRGFVLLRALPVDDWNRREAATAFFGIGAHLGAARSQNAQGHLLGHVKDVGRSSSDPSVRIYQ